VFVYNNWIDELQLSAGTIGNHNYSNNAARPQMPGISELVDVVADSSNNITTKLPPGLYLLSGPAAAGKTMYCRQFVADGLFNRDICIFISSSMTEHEFKKLFSCHCGYY
jgi:KaiC/GvpD/RAD55 family RecA-like ATPase